jgi:hypothetical protein
LDRDDEFRPWGPGELFPDKLSDPRRHDPDNLLARWWADNTATDEGDDEPDIARRLAVTAPYGQTWPGLAPVPPKTAAPEQQAAEYAVRLLTADPSMRLGPGAGGFGG